MKKFATTIIAVLVSYVAFSQIRPTFFLNPTPPPNINEWGVRKEVLQLIVPPGPGLALQFKIKTEIKSSDGSMVATTDLARAQTYSLQSTVLILTAVDVIPLEFMIFSGKYKTSLDRTGKLPSDNYTMCVTLVRPQDYTPVSQPVCQPFYMAAIQLPVLMKPYNEEILDGQQAQTAITFRWTPVVPRLASVTYRLQVFEILDYQTPVQALRANQPLLDQELTNITQYIWRPQLNFTKGGDITDGQKNINTSEAGLGSGKGGKAMMRFVWTIQTLDQGNPIIRTDGSGEARSEPLMFYVDQVKIKNAKSN